MMNFNLLYVDPSVVTYGAAALGSVIVAVGAFVAILWRKAKKKVAETLKLEEKSNKEEDAEVQVQAKGSDEAKGRFPDCTLTDLSKVASATMKVLPNGNYQITIIMADEDTPMNKESSFLAKVTSSILFWEGIQETIDGLSVIKAVNSKSVLYNDYKIVAEMKPNGQFVSLGHFATVDINANAKITLVGDIALSGKLLNTCKYSDFKY